MAQQFPLASEAYVAGHHASAFGAWLDASREEATLGLPPRGGREARCPGIGELNRALRALAVAKTTEAPILVEVHRAVDAIHRSSRRLLRAWVSGDRVGLHPAFVRGQRWVDVLLDLTTALLVPSAGSGGWLALGAAVGRCRRICRDAAASCELPEGVLDEVRGAAERLRVGSSGSVLQPLLALTQPVPAEADGALAAARAYHHFHQNVARADETLQCALRGMPAPQPDLVLNSEQLVLFGQAFNLSELPRTQIAALWVLAENVGRPVQRATIKSEGRIQTAVKRMGEVMSRLRRMLADLANASGRTGGDKRAYIRERIRGKVGRHPTPGPYILDLPPELVHVSQPRPTWMR